MAIKEMTKIIVKECMECGGDIQILCNETAYISMIRCPKCYFEWIEDNKKIKVEVKEK